jgi:hypothetical protein
MLHPLQFFEPIFPEQPIRFLEEDLFAPSKPPEQCHSNWVDEIASEHPAAADLDQRKSVL